MKKDFKNINILLFTTLLWGGCSASNDNQLTRDKSEKKGEISLEIAQSEVHSLSSPNKFDFDFLKNIDTSKKENSYFEPYSLNNLHSLGSVKVKSFSNL